MSLTFVKKIYGVLLYTTWIFKLKKTISYQNVPSQNVIEIQFCNDTSLLLYTLLEYTVWPGRCFAMMFKTYAYGRTMTCHPSFFEILKDQGGPPTSLQGCHLGKCVGFLPGYPLKLYFKFPVFSLFFPCPKANFPCANLCDLWILHTQNLLSRRFNLKKKFGDFHSKFRISFTFRIKVFTTWANQIPCVLAKSSNSLCFPWHNFFFGIFPVFPVHWVPCSSLQSVSPCRVW